MLLLGLKEHWEKTLQKRFPWQVGLYQMTLNILPNSKI